MPDLSVFSGAKLAKFSRLIKFIGDYFQLLPDKPYFCRNFMQHWADDTEKNFHIKL